MTQLELYEKYPNLFDRRYLDKSQSCMAWGISCHEGWYGLIDQLSEELSVKCPNVQYEQIKEKFGSLRVYLHNGNDTAYEIVSKYEKMSPNICEECGDPGEIVNVNGWLSCKCINHQRK